jgi:hypothetical protein
LIIRGQAPSSQGSARPNDNPPATTAIRGLDSVAKDTQANSRDARGIILAPAR